MFSIAVLVSGGGTDLQSIIDSINIGYLSGCSIKLVISDRNNVYALERCKRNNINSYILDKGIYKDKLSDRILELVEEDVDLIVCAGWLSILKGELISKFKNRIINIHPSLIPAFCGDGMYGMKVHERVIESGVKLSGCTVHFVDEGTDTGPIIIQEPVPVYDDDTAETLQRRVLEQEHKVLPKAIKLISQEKVRVKGKKVIIDNR